MSYAYRQNEPAESFESLDGLNAPNWRGELHGRTSQGRQLLNGYVLTDLVAMTASFVLAWGAAALINLAMGRVLEQGFFTAPLRPAQFAMVALGVVLWFQHTDHYRVRLPFWIETKTILSALGFAMLVDGFVQFATKVDFSRLWLVSSWLLAMALVPGLRAGWRMLLQSRGQLSVPTLLIGQGDLAERTARALISEPGLGYNITARIPNLAGAFLQAGRSWEKLCAAHGAEYVVIALEGDALDAAEQPIAQMMRESIPFSMVPPTRNLPVMGMVPHYFFNHDVALLARANRLEQPLPRLFKRGFDIVVTGSALLVLSPVFLLMALLVKLDGGPALYGSLRMGKQGRPFACLKFRSMVVDGDKALEKYLEKDADAREEWETYRKLKEDPRVTKIGKFLRRNSLDELPQLLNVLLGDMSLVGPRPITLDEVAIYDSDIAHYYRVRPGITGLWQVSGRNDVTYRERVQMDSWYVRNWSLWHDIAILCKTVPALLSRKGVY